MKLVAQMLIMLAVSLAPGAANLDPMTAQDRKPTAETSIKLPGLATEMQPAKEGDLLVVKMPDDRMLGIVDVAKAKLVRTIRTSSTEFLYASGGSRAVVFEPASSTFSTYNLEDGATLATKKSTLNRTVMQLIMASGDGEFALVFTVGQMLANGSFYRMDLKSLDPEPVSSGVNGPNLPHDTCFRLGHDGRMFTAWSSSRGPIVGELTGKELELRSGHTRVGHILPLPYREMAVTGSGLVLDAWNRTVTEHEGVQLFPDHTGQYYLGKTSHYDRDRKVNVFSGATHHLIARLDLDVEFGNWHSRETTVFPLSRHNVLAAFSESKGSVVLHEFDPIASLRKSGVDFLVVLSAPPRTMPRGTTMEYVVEAATNAKSFSVEMVEGPKDAALEGKVLKWSAPKDADGKEVRFKLRVATPRKDEIVFDFKVTVTYAPKK